MHAEIERLGSTVNNGRLKYVWSYALAQPVYVNHYVMQGEAIGTVIDIEPSVQYALRRRSSMFEIGYQFVLPVLKATTTYDIETTGPEVVSLFH